MFASVFMDLFVLSIRLLMSEQKDRDLPNAQISEEMNGSLFVKVVKSCKILTFKVYLYVNFFFIEQYHFRSTFFDSFKSFKSTLSFWRFYATFNLTTWSRQIGPKYSIKRVQIHLYYCEIVPPRIPKQK